MAAAMNAIGYDAAALGNHEFNYGMDTLRAFQRQLRFPLLGANAVDWTTGAPTFPPYVLKRVRTPHGKDVMVGILGLVTPGVAIWDRDNVEGKVRFPGIVEQAADVRAAAEARRRRRRHRLVPLGLQDLLVVRRRAALPREREHPAGTAGSRTSTPSSSGTPTRRSPSCFVTNEKTGRKVLLSEPLKWGMRLTVMDLDLVLEQGRWTVGAAHAHLLNANTVPEDPAVARLLARDHSVVRQYVNSVIGTNVTADVRGHLALRGHRGDGLRQRRPGPGGPEGPGRHRRRERPRCCPSRRRSTGTPPSRPAT